MQTDDRGSRLQSGAILIMKRILFIIHLRAPIRIGTRHGTHRESSYSCFQFLAGFGMTTICEDAFSASFELKRKEAKAAN
jgi:hypothetical protein